MPQTPSGGGSDTAQWLPRLLRKDYTVALNLTGNGLDEPDQTLYENFTCGAEGNYDANPELDKMVDRQSMEFDQAKRKELVWAIERKLAEDGPSDPLSQPVGHVLAALCEGLRPDDQQHLQRLAHGRRVAR